MKMEKYANLKIFLQKPKVLFIQTKKTPKTYCCVLGMAIGDLN